MGGKDIVESFFTYLDDLALFEHQTTEKHDTDLSQYTTRHRLNSVHSVNISWVNRILAASTFVNIVLLMTQSQLANGKPPSALI